MAKELSNLSGLNRTHGMMYLTCPICFITFGRYACQVARVENPTCSYACAGKAREVRVFKPCIVCGVEMEQTPSEADRVVTCSKRCRFIRKTQGRGQPVRLGSTGVYRAAVKELYALGGCAKCATKIGPWAVRGLQFEFVDGYAVMKSSGELWCRACHLTDVAPLGTPAREQRKSDEER